jgi:hypothetical protein
MTRSSFHYPIYLALALCVNVSVQASEFSDLLESYGVLETVAGAGMQDTGIHWMPTMEGGPAVEAELSRPHMTMADAAGNLYIADKENHAIRKVTTDGTIHTVAGTNIDGDGPDQRTRGNAVALSLTNGLYTFPDGTTYILDRGNGKIRSLSPDGWLDTVVVDPNPIIHGRGLWVSPDERLIVYSSGTELKQWSQDGGLTTLTEGFEELGNITVDARGDLIVTDRGGHQVSRVDAQGVATVIAGTGKKSKDDDGTALGTALDNVRGIAFLPNNSYFLASHADSQILFVDTKGNIHLFLDGKKKSDLYAGDQEWVGTEGKKLSEPRAITIAPNGDLLITERDIGFVRIVRRLRAPTDLEIQQDTNDRLVLTWQAEAHSRYLVEASVDLSPNSWQTLEEFDASSPQRLLYTSPSLTDAGSNYGHLRVRSVPVD